MFTVIAITLTLISLLIGQIHRTDQKSDVVIVSLFLITMLSWIYPVGRLLWLALGWVARTMP